MKVNVVELLLFFNYRYIHDPRKSAFCVFLPRIAQTNLLSYKDWLDYGNVAFTYLDYCNFHLTNNKDTDRTAPMRRMACAFISQGFSRVEARMIKIQVLAIKYKAPPKGFLQ